MSPAKRLCLLVGATPLLILLVSCVQTGSPEPHAAGTEPATNAPYPETPLPDYSQLPPGDLIAFVGVNVVPMDSDRILSAQTVIVYGDRILWIGPADDTVLPDGVTLIEGEGRYLLPGLADMHVHIRSEKDFPLYLANGVTVLRNMNGSPTHLQWRQEVASGERIGPTIYTAGPTIDGDPGVYGGGMLSIGTVQEAGESVRAQKDAGYDFIKVYSLLSLEVYDAIIAEARLQGLPVVGHVPVYVGVEHALQMGQSSLEHLLGYVDALESPDSDLGGEWSYRRLYGGIEIDEARISELASATREAEAWNCPTLVAMDRLMPASEAQPLLDQPHMRYVSPEMRARWSAMRGFVDSWLADSDPAIRRHGYEVRRLILKGLRDAGAGLLVGTDAGAIYVEPGFSIHVELQNFLEAGLSPYEALSAATQEAADYLGAGDEFGTIATGKRADLILLEGNPLENLSTLQEPVGVMLRGHWLPADRLQEMLDDLVAD